MPPLIQHPPRAPAAKAEPRTVRGETRLHLAGLEDIVGLHLGIGHSLLVQRLDPKLKALDLTAKQVTILWLAEANPDLTQIEIARFLEIERSTIHQFVRSLVRNALVEVVPSATDGRSTRISLTAKGRERLAQARDVIMRHEAEAATRLTAIERRLLLDLLAKLRGAGEPD